MSHTYGKSAHLLTARVQVLLLDCFSLKDLPSPKAIPRLGKNEKKQRSRSGAAALLGQIVLNKSSVSDGMLSSQLTHLHPDQSLCIVRKLEKVSTCLTGCRTKENILKTALRNGLRFPAHDTPNLSIQNPTQ